MPDNAQKQHSGNTNEPEWMREERATKLLEEQRDKEREKKQDPLTLRSDKHPSSHRFADRTLTIDETRTRPTRKSLYAIIDRVTDAILGGIQLHLNDASAARTTGDVAAQPDSMLRKHPGDFVLVKLGTLDDENNITPTYEVVVSAEQLQEFVNQLDQQPNHGA